MAADGEGAMQEASQIVAKPEAVKNVGVREGKAVSFLEQVRLRRIVRSSEWTGI